MNDFTLKALTGASESPAATDARVRRAPVQQRAVGRPASERVPLPAKDQVKAVVEQIDSFLKAAGRELQFQVDEESGEIIVRVRDPATGDVIRQIPGEEALRMARTLHEKPPVLLDLTV